MKGNGKPSVGGIIFILVLLAFFIYLQINMGLITIIITGQPTINDLTNKLNVCQAELNDKCDPCPECVEKTIISDLALIFFGGIVGFFYFLFFGENLKQWLLKRWQSEKKEKRNEHNKRNNL